jgi:hypothetical protein
VCSGQAIVYGVRDTSLSRSSPLGEFVDVFIRREDAERFVEDVRRGEPALAANLRIE